MPTTPPVTYLGTMNAVPCAAVLERAGVDPQTHEVLTWHDPKKIDAARTEGRLVAEFRVRHGDPMCYVARLSDAQLAARTLGRKGGAAGKGTEVRREVARKASAASPHSGRPLTIKGAVRLAKTAHARALATLGPDARTTQTLKSALVDLLQQEASLAQRPALSSDVLALVRQYAGYARSAK